MALKALFSQRTELFARTEALLDRVTFTILAGTLVQYDFDYAAIYWCNRSPQLFETQLRNTIIINKLIRVILKRPK